jgi:hypothetical protein
VWIGEGGEGVVGTVMCSRDEILALTEHAQYYQGGGMEAQDLNRFEIESFPCTLNAILKLLIQSFNLLEPSYIQGSCIDSE